MGPVIYSLVLSCLRNLYHHLLISLTLLTVATHLISCISPCCICTHNVYRLTSCTAQSLLAAGVMNFVSAIETIDALPDISRRHPMHQRAHLFATCYVSLIIYRTLNICSSSFDVPSGRGSVNGMLYAV